ncbi:Alpha/Beta hydrolase protein [Kickxella alabastrina]|uniref:Alpha/Beta hydrolase protein n=1 Tax=Kickxella alabastrina TaxID=61397 RepID=UPI00221ECC30|nr:Alpha/Beta hydrolase protein [Kickxella alabastrina]KAI7829125.1 Alpha/Beta hydrolase protein [Kickxella alabastrina]
MPYNPLLATSAIAVGAAVMYRKNTIDSSGVSLLHAPQTARIEGKKTLLDIITAECPSLADPEKARFVPTPMLPTADFQTCYNAIRERFGKLKIVKYERELITTEDGGTIGLDWSPPFTQMPEDDRPIVVLSHGLSGGSQETYVQTAIKALTSAPYNFRTVVVNFRGCAGVKLTTHVLYNGGFTSDYGIAVEYIKGRFPQSKLVAIGYSLGANLITKYVGEQGEVCPLKAAISVGNPYDLAASSDAIEEPTFRNKYVYSPAMLEGLMRLYRRHSKMMATGPVKLDAKAIAKIKSIREFDELITSRVFGYKNSTDYYQQNSSAQFMPNISIPFLAITALDDPVCPDSYIPRETFRSNPHLVLALTQYGGHLGYHESLSQSWLPRPIAEFCSAIFNHTTV